MSDRLLGEAISAVTQCAHILGADRANRIIGEIDRVRQEIDAYLSPLGEVVSVVSASQSDLAP